MTGLTTKGILESVVSGENLTDVWAESFLNEVMVGNVSEAILASFLTAVKIKGETKEELTGFIRAMRNHAIKPKNQFDFDFLDTCGTGGDGKGSLNVSTLSALCLASLGVKVAKHGNRSVSSLSGSSDILQSLGYSLEKSPEVLETEFLEHGFVFLFAPSFHPAMKYAGPVRRELGFRTFFNLIGPLSNPYRPNHQIVGVYDAKLTRMVAEILVDLGAKRVMVCHSNDGLDEFSIFDRTKYSYFNGKEILDLEFDPAELGLGVDELDKSSVFADSKEQAEKLFRSVLEGKSSAGLAMVSLNAGMALLLMGKCQNPKDGYLMAKNAFLDKKVLRFVRETLNLS
ncbi:anthranilate phosphoribosyltransferase [Leptospira sp. 96542]|nr:anthranilate phosphoribosyltransferase [Leptospira sp. 96542]